MSIVIEKKFRLESPLEQAWRYMSDPELVAPCLPGVELTEVVGETKYLGNVRVKVGPMTVAYKGEAALTERDDEARTFEIVGKGKEKGGAGSAKMRLEASMEENDGGVQVAVKATLDLTGKVVRFGRGMIQGVSDQLFEEFVSNVRANLESSSAEPAEPSGSFPESDSVVTLPTGHAPPSRPEPAGTKDADAKTDERPSPDVSEEAPESGEGNSSPADEPDGDSGAHEPDESEALVSTRPASRLAPPSEPVSALPLFFKAIWSMIKRFFSRLFGRD